MTSKEMEREETIKQCDFLDALFRRFMSSMGNHLNHIPNADASKSALKIRIELLRHELLMLEEKIDRE